jgi:phage gpG-like protein
VSISVTGQVVGIEKVERRFLLAGELVPKKVLTAVQALGLDLLRKVKEDFLSGRALNVRSGKLRRGVNEKTTENGGLVSSSVGTNTAYARPWETGFTGTESVRAHTRRMKKRGVAAQVRAHTRDVTMRARPFLKPALDEMRPRVVAELNEALRGL